MREVPVPTRFAAQPLRRAIVMIAAWLIVAQAFLAGVATAQTGVMLSSDPLAAAVICHNRGTADPADTAVPDANAVWHLCCVSCTAATPATVVPQVTGVARMDIRGAAALPVLAPFIVLLAHGAVRDGPSQAPPSRA
jgi:hypothetical protein